jgi:hypothetical protein
MTEYEVELFLNDFKTKMQFMDIVFLNDRGKNAKTLAILEIPVTKQKQIIEELEVKDYSEGPIEDTNFVGSPLWVFGKIVKGHEVYIKISMGMPNRSTLCISFHISEFPINYPLK